MTKKNVLKEIKKDEKVKQNAMQLKMEAKSILLQWIFQSGKKKRKKEKGKCIIRFIFLLEK